MTHSSALNQCEVFMVYGGLSVYASWKSDSAIHVAVLGRNFIMYDFLAAKLSLVRIHLCAYKYVEVI